MNVLITVIALLAAGYGVYSAITRSRKRRGQSRKAAPGVTRPVDKV